MAGSGATVQIPMCNGAVLHLPRGFRFSPSDEDLVVQYLRRRAVGEPLPCAAIGDADLRRYNPWALVPPAGGAKEKYLFARVGLEHAGGRRADIAAGEGYWRATGAETPVHDHRDLALVGVKSELVFYRGAAPAGLRTRWAMDEYRLAGAGLRSYTVASPPPLCPRCAAAGAMGKKNDALPAAHGDQLVCAPTVPMTVNPDASWIICRIYKKKKRVPRVTMQGTSANAGGPADGGPSPTSSCITDTFVEEEDEVGNVGGDKKVCTK